jgi:hypothetical protein
MSITTIEDVHVRIGQVICYLFRQRVVAGLVGYPFLANTGLIAWER